MNTRSRAPKSKTRIGCVALALSILGAGAFVSYRIHAWAEAEIRKEADAIAFAESLPRSRLAILTEQSAAILRGKAFQPPARTAGLMWDDETGFPEGFSDIRPYRIDVVQEEEVWFCIYKNRDLEVVIAVLDPLGASKVILRTGLDENYRFKDRKILYEK